MAKAIECGNDSSYVGDAVRSASKLGSSGSGDVLASKSEPVNYAMTLQVLLRGVSERHEADVVTLSLCFMSKICRRAVVILSPSSARSTKVMSTNSWEMAPFDETSTSK
jgi:hypothetical protein